MMNTYPADTLSDAQSVARLMSTTLVTWLKDHHLPTDGSVEINGRIVPHQCVGMMDIEPHVPISLDALRQLSKSLYRALWRLIPKSCDDIVYYIYHERGLERPKTIISLTWKMEVSDADSLAA